MEIVLDVGWLGGNASNGDSRFENRFMIGHDNGLAIKILPFQEVRLVVRSSIHDTARLGNIPTYIAYVFRAGYL